VDSGPCQYPAGEWSVTFEVAHTEDGGFALGFLARLVNDNARRPGRRVILERHR
jgi:hypothetical protein